MSTNLENLEKLQEKLREIQEKVEKIEENLEKAIENIKKVNEELRNFEVIKGYTEALGVIKEIIKKS